MTKKILTLSLLTALFLTSCKDGTKTDNVEKSTTQNAVAKTSDEIVTSSSSNKEGKTLEMIFNNTKDIATISFEGEKIELVGQHPASGIWYKNENYELTGKGNDLLLTKNGEVIFEHMDNIPTTKDKTNSEANNAKMKQTQKEAMSTWWKGKHFENNRSVGKNPEEGGADFLIINQDQTASYKVGDIIDVMTWKANGANITFKNKMTEREIIFKIGDSFLMDSYGTKWTIKK